MSASLQGQHTGRARRWRERVATAAICSGGAMVLITVALLVLYLLAEILPLLSAPSVRALGSVPAPDGIAAARSLQPDAFADSYVLRDERGNSYRYQAGLGHYGSGAVSVEERPESLEPRSTELAGQRVAAWLPGGDSVLLQRSDESLTLSIRVSGAQAWQPLYEFAFAAPVVVVRTEPQRRVFYVATSDAQIQAFHATTGRRLLDWSLTQAPVDLALSSLGDRLLVLLPDGSVQRFAIQLPHPEVSLQSLFSSLWFEGYEKPGYVWQSTTADSRFEPKYSLVPLLFGTFKVALYTMLLCAPLAVCAAIYTAYFMAPALRRKVKPVIELMEAMPTVVVGFLAGLWFAPWLESRLAVAALAVLTAPLLLILVALCGRWIARRRLSTTRLHGWLPLVLLPLVMLWGWGLVPVAAWWEAQWLPGGVALWLEQAGLVYEQRNALVLGVAMGVAVVPSVFSLTEDALFAVPSRLAEGGLALGATPWQAVAGVVLPCASPGIFSALMIGLARAVGETMIVLMVAGNTPLLDWSPLVGMRALSANIAMEMPEAQFQSSHYRVLLLAAALLFFVTFVFNTLAESVRQGLRRRYGTAG